MVLLILGFARAPIAHVWRKPSRHELDALRAEGDGILQSLAEYRAHHHRYPSDLSSFRDSSLGSKYGGWQYTCVAECSGFKLFVGHYADYSFEIHWQPDKKTWYIDT